MKVISMFLSRVPLRGRGQPCELSPDSDLEHSTPLQGPFPTDASYQRVLRHLP